MVRFGVLMGAAVAAALGACTHARDGSPVDHLGVFGVEPPHHNTVYVCHAYGCQMKTKFHFTDADIAELRSLMETTRKDDTPYEELRAVAYAIAWMERRVGDVIGTKDDRPGMDFAASGDPTQQDCVDESTNTTSYMLVLQDNGLLRHHTVARPFAKDQLWRGVAGWTHWTAVLKDNVSGQRWAVDSWIYANGENPAIVEVEKWYIADLATLPKATQ